MLIGALSGFETALAYVVLPSIGAAVAILTYQRSRKAGKLSNALTTVQLWEAETTALKNRLESVERQNAEQAQQIEHLLATNRLLTEQVTNAAAVGKLTDIVIAQHREVMAALGRTA